MGPDGEGKIIEFERGELTIERILGDDLIEAIIAHGGDITFEKMKAGLDRLCPIIRENRERVIRTPIPSSRIAILMLRRVENSEIFLDAITVQGGSLATIVFTPEGCRVLRHDESIISNPGEWYSHTTYILKPDSHPGGGEPEPIPVGENVIQLRHVSSNPPKEKEKAA